MVTHLLIQTIIYIGRGLYTVFISAWKSGRNPSASIDTINSTMPRIYVFFSSFLEPQGSKNLNMTMPRVTITPTAIFLGPSFSLLSATREQSTPTRMTERMLQDLNIITTGQLVRQMAQVQVRVDTATVKPQMAEFLSGIFVLLCQSIWQELMRQPSPQVMPQGKMRKAEGQEKVSSTPVQLFIYLPLILNSSIGTWTRG